VQTVEQEYHRRHWYSVVLLCAHARARGLGKYAMTDLVADTPRKRAYPLCVADGKAAKKGCFAAD